MSLKKASQNLRGKNTQGWWIWWLSANFFQAFYIRHNRAISFITIPPRGCEHEKKMDHNWSWWSHRTFEHWVRAIDLFWSLVDDFKNTLIATYWITSGSNCGTCARSSLLGKESIQEHQNLQFLIICKNISTWQEDLSSTSFMKKSQWSKSCFI